MTFPALEALAGLGVAHRFTLRHADIDVDAERARVTKELAKVEAELEKVSAKLADANFTSKVPQKVLDDHTQRQADWSAQLAKLKVMLEALG